MWRVRCAVHTPGRLQQTAVSCKRSDYNKKKLAKCHFWAALWKNCTTGLTVLFAALSRAQMCVTFLKKKYFSWAPPGIVPLPPRCSGWRRRRMPFLVLRGSNRCDSLFSRLTVETMQFLLMPRWSLNGVSSVHCCQMYWERSTNFFCIESTHLPSFDGWNLSARPCPSGCILLQFDQCWVAIHQMMNRSGNDREFLQNLFWCISFSDYGQYGVVFVLQSSHDDCHEVVPS